VFDIVGFVGHMIEKIAKQEIQRGCI